MGRWVDSWRQNGLVNLWIGEVVVLGADGPLPRDRPVERFVGVPGMSAICRHPALDLDITLKTRVVQLERLEDRWRLLSGCAVAGQILRQ